MKTVQLNISSERADERLRETLLFLVIRRSVLRAKGIYLGSPRVIQDHGEKKLRATIVEAQQAGLQIEGLLDISKKTILLSMKLFPILEEKHGVGYLTSDDFSTNEMAGEIQVILSQG
jgi:hypothetical protein